MDSFGHDSGSIDKFSQSYPLEALLGLIIWLPAEYPQNIQGVRVAALGFIFYTMIALFVVNLYIDL